MLIIINNPGKENHQDLSGFYAHLQVEAGVERTFVAAI